MMGLYDADGDGVVTLREAADREPSGRRDRSFDGFLALVRAAGARMTVDFASGTPVSINDIVATMASTLGVDVTVRHEGTVPEYIEFRSADTTMRDRFGIAPAITFPDGLKRLSAFLGRN